MRTVLGITINKRKYSMGRDIIKGQPGGKAGTGRRLGYSITQLIISEKEGVKRLASTGIKKSTGTACLGWKGRSSGTP